MTILGTRQAGGVCRHPMSWSLYQKCTVVLLKMEGFAYRDPVLLLPSAELGRGAWKKRGENKAMKQVLNVPFPAGAVQKSF